jgi:hypothetical protein
MDYDKKFNNLTRWLTEGTASRARRAQLVQFAITGAMLACDGAKDAEGQCQCSRFVRRVVLWLLEKHEGELAEARAEALRKLDRLVRADKQAGRSMGGDPDDVAVKAAAILHHLGLETSITASVRGDKIEDVKVEARGREVKGVSKRATIEWRDRPPTYTEALAHYEAYPFDEGEALWIAQEEAGLPAFVRVSPSSMHGQDRVDATYEDGEHADWFSPEDLTSRRLSERWRPCDKEGAPVAWPSLEERDAK